MKMQYILVWICVAGWSKSNAIPTGQINNFQYVNIPAEHQYEFAFNRGSAEHQISRHQLVKDGNFQAKVKWSDTHEGVGGSYFDYNHAGNRDSITIKANAYYEPIAHHQHHQYHQQPRQPDYKSEETANSEWEPDYADFDDKIDEVQITEPELFDSKPSSSSASPSAAVASALVQQLPKKNIETLLRLPTLSIAQHLLNVYSLVDPQQ